SVTASASRPRASASPTSSAGESSPSEATVCACRSTVPASAGIVDRARLPDQRDLDLAGVLERVLDLLDDVAGEPNRAEVVHLLRPDDDAYLAPGLYRERALDARERVGDALERLEPPDVALDRLAPGARPGARDRVGRRDDDRVDALRLLVVVVGRDGVD